MVPDRDYCQSIPRGANCEVANEKDEVAIVLRTEAVVYPGTVMIHCKDTLVAHLAVRSASWFDNITPLAVSRPNLFEIFNRLMPVLHYGLDLFGDALKPLLVLFQASLFHTNRLA